jgi:hypothetical protein
MIVLIVDSMEETVTEMQLSRHAAFFRLYLIQNVVTYVDTCTRVCSVTPPSCRTIWVRAPVLAVMNRDTCAHS